MERSRRKTMNHPSRKRRNRFFALLLSVVLAVSAACAPAFAAEAADPINVGNVDINRILNSAARMEGQDAGDLGYTSQWSGYFIRTIAESADLGKLFPPAAECATGARLLAAMPKYGGRTTVFYSDMTAVVGKTGVTLSAIYKYVPKPGDVVVFRTSYDSEGAECISQYAHIGIVMEVTDAEIVVISGNWNGVVTVGTRFSRYGITEVDSYYYSVAGYARPNYPFAVAQLHLNFNADGGGIAGQDHVISYYRIITKNGINLRSGPDTTYPSLDVLPLGTEFAVEETRAVGKYVWGKTTSGGIEGWLVISNKTWVERYAMDATPYYLDETGAIYDRAEEKPSELCMELELDYPAGVPSAEEFGVRRGGFVFAGWSDTPGGAVTVIPGTPIRPERLCPELVNGDQHLTLYAVWTEIEPEGTSGGTEAEPEVTNGASLAGSGALILAAAAGWIALRRKKENEPVFPQNIPWKG